MVVLVVMFPPHSSIPYKPKVSNTAALEVALVEANL